MQFFRWYFFILVLSHTISMADIQQLHIDTIVRELNIREQQVRATAALLAEDATVPFIARYRKEVTGSLDEVQITAIRDRITQLVELDKRREAILSSLAERNLLTDELHQKLVAATTMSGLEDLYLPFRPKRRTRATIAKEKGLEPLALVLFAQEYTTIPRAEAEAFVSAEKGVETVESALAGARDIIAEWVNEDLTARSRVRELYLGNGTIRTRVVPGKETEGAKFRDYFEWQEPVASAPSHRVLAMRRGEKEEFLSLDVAPPEEDALALLEGLFVKNNTEAAEQVRLAVRDSFKRLLSLSMETEIRLLMKERADREAIRVFGENLRQLLLASPLGEKRVLAIDPGFRTGCKVVCLSPQGQLLHTENIYPHEPQKRTEEAAKAIYRLVEKFAVEVVAIGNGTAGRETENFVRDLHLPIAIAIVMVNESGASIYSASDVAREEFPDQDITVRGAVSIGRRLMDPLAELVKIDPKSIGVGQYQHDVDQGWLRDSLNDTVVSCVNAVGVDVNTASKQLLAYVSGLGPRLAQNIVEYRNEHGAFHSRKEMKKVPRLGDKAFEQAAGFLRIRDGVHPLDASAVHPESYPIVEAMARDLGCTVGDLLHSADMRKRIDLRRYVSDTVGLPTLNDIVQELAKPGRDPREKFEVFQFADGINAIGDVKIGMKLPGIVTNVTAFGAFVDIGVHQDGLVHISQLANRFVQDPAQVVKVQQKVMVKVIDVDLERKRIQLSMKEV